MTIKKLYVGLAIAILLFAVTSSAFADRPIVKRPIEDFLDGQGQSSFWIPPIPDQFGWADTNFTVFAMVDYLGAAAEWIEAQPGNISLGTKIKGSVTETALDSETVLVQVSMQTDNALVWAFETVNVDWDNVDWDVDKPFGDTPLSFGYRHDEVAAGATPVLVKAFLEVDFIRPGTPGDGGALPDLQTLGNGTEILFLNFHANAKGPLHALFGVEEGTPGRLRIHETMIADEDGIGVWTMEVTDLWSLDD